MAFIGLTGWELFIFVALVFLFFIVGTIVTIHVVYKRRWKFNVVIIENTAGQGYSISSRDKARIITVGNGGEELFLLRKSKKYRVGYGKRIGVNQIAFAVGEDGYWYNWSFGNLNKKLLEMGVVPVDKDQRYANASIRKLIDQRYDKKGFMEKYGTTIAVILIIVAIVIQGVSTYVTNRQHKQISDNNLKASETSLKVMETSEKIISSLDNLNPGGSGLVPVT